MIKSKDHAGISVLTISGKCRDDFRNVRRALSTVHATTTTPDRRTRSRAGDDAACPAERRLKGAARG